MFRPALLTLLLLPTANEIAAQEANDELIEMVIGLMSDEDKDIRGVAFEQIRTEIKGQAATERFAAKLPKLPPEAQAGLLAALGDRGDVAAKPAVYEMLSSKPPVSSFVASVRALAKLGDAKDTQKFTTWLSHTDKTVKAAARLGLIQLQGDTVSTAIVESIVDSPKPIQLELIEILTARRAQDTIPELLKLAQGNDATMRGAAMNALGELAAPEHIDGMVKAVLKAKKGNERSAAEKCLMFVCKRIKEQDKRAEPLLASMKGLNATDWIAMTPTLGRVGGKPAWVEVQKAITSRDAATHLAGIRAISNWPDASVAEELKKIAKSDKHTDHQRIARMSLLRIAPLPDGRTDQEKLELLKSSMQLAANDKERNYGIKRAAAIRLVETLRYVLPFVDQPEFSTEACNTIVELAHDRSLRDDNKPEFHAALDKVISKTKNSQLVERANRYKNGQTWVRPK